MVAKSFPMINYTFILARKCVFVKSRKSFCGEKTIFAIFPLISRLRFSRFASKAEKHHGSDRQITTHHAALLCYNIATPKTVRKGISVSGTVYSRRRFSENVDSYIQERVQS